MGLKSFSTETAIPFPRERAVLLRTTANVLKRLLKAYRGQSPQHRLPKWPKNRGFDLYLPNTPQTPPPLILVFHGYTQDGGLMRRLTGPTDRDDDPKVFDRAANARGYAVCYPYGTKIGFLPGRCWNAGGRQGGYAPVGDPAVRLKVDDIAFVDDLLSHLTSHFGVDPHRVFLAGISNGGALIQRLATVHPENFLALASVAACNQYSASNEAPPERCLPLLHIHGTKDKVWPYQGGKMTGLGLMESVENSVAGWVRAAGNPDFSESDLEPLDPKDPIRVRKKRYRGSHPIELYTLVGGGHYWPGGSQFLSEKVIGKVSNQLDANGLILDFFDQYLDTGTSTC